MSILTKTDIIFLFFFSGMKGLTENPDSLLTWMLAGPDVMAVIDLFEEALKQPDPSDQNVHHHNDTKAAREDFRRDVEALKDAFLGFGNPFSYDGEDLFNIETGQTVHPDVCKKILSIETKGKEQYENFCKNRLESGNLSIFETIPLNKFPRMQSCVKKSKASSKVAALKNDCALFSKLWISNQLRQGDMNEFFDHENENEPPALTNNAEMRTGDKSQIVPCLIKEAPNCVAAARPPVDAIILDGAVIANMVQPSPTDKTFGDYEATYASYVKREAEHAVRVDIVNDIYLEDSLKRATREKRGDAPSIHVSSSKRLPRHWATFLRGSCNKDKLFKVLAEKLIICDWGLKVVRATHQNLCLTSAKSGPGKFTFTVILAGLSRSSHSPFTCEAVAPAEPRVGQPA